MDIPIEIYQEILEYSDFLIQIRLTQVSNYFHIELRIRDFYTIDKKLHLLNWFLKRRFLLRKTLMAPTH